MTFTDPFIQRPIMAIALSFLVLILGLQAVFKLQVREYPEMTNTDIIVSTSYYGAPAEVIQGFITQPLQQAVAEADKIDFLESSSRLGSSTITAHMKVGTDPNAALAEIMAKVNSVNSQLPQEAENPSISSKTGSNTALMYLSFFSERLSTAHIGDYLKRNVQNQLLSVEGVSTANVLAPALSIRIWLDPKAMATHNLTTNEINTILANNNYRSAPGQVKSRYFQYTIQVDTDLNDIEAFKQMIVAQRTEGVIRLRDIAKVELSSVREAVKSRIGGINAVVIAIESTPTANPLDVAKRVTKKLAEIERNLAAGIKMEISYDATEYIEASIYEVLRTIGEAGLIVILVIFLFMGSFRAMLIPIVTIPFSLIGVCLAMQMLGFSINLLTLLAMVLAIGLVVDDAIVVVENVERHLQMGKTPFAAAIVGTREIAVPVISMTIALAAVYSPIALLDGVTGTLFKEFALTLAGAVVVSGMVALTLSPAMCSLILKHSEHASRFELGVQSTMGRVERGYGYLLDRTLAHRSAILLFAFIVMGSLIFLFPIIPSELAPNEEKGAFLGIATAPSSANLDFIDANLTEIGKRANQINGIRNTLSLSGMPSTNNGLAVMLSAPWEQRENSEKQMIALLTDKVKDIAGVNMAAFPLPALPGGGSGLPIQMVIKSTADYETMMKVALELQEKANASHLFIFNDLDIKFDTATIKMHINRDKAGSYGITMAEIANTLSTLVGDGRVNYINRDGRSYEVVPQVIRTDRLTPEALGSYYLRTASGQQIPLSELVSLKVRGEPSSLIQMDQANAITLGGVPMPTTTVGNVLTFLTTEADKILPSGFSYDFKGPSRQYMQEGSSLYITFILALAIIFLVLAIQFESWRDPLVIMVSVPLALCGALLVMAWGVASLNIYTQIGLITLIGLITKHGILMCEVAKERQLYLQESKMDAIQHAARIRLRPILMTVIAMVSGVIPLLYAAGPGAAARFSIGIVIFSGLSIGTLFTLFVLPTVYSFLGETHKPLPIYKEPVSLDKEEVTVSTI
ncbi:efflux RND transporter permease subunit [Beggiatoa leptomitoformis]|uniref:MMPL family transporter n=1 Tax=Beggiatoa leptomitoformis TaxID=288004 RepID=A0A2N9YGS1_9GAMM|nr:efflux RND transporter permease subunit [Beggiatoa leptomitoformis]ALG68283.1 MMPL family transporter [Beggiatoa leptomitoformis]AUI69406.1 MMPL family transporter [Beggiatoa leptomitoformis]